MNVYYNIFSIIIYLDFFLQHMQIGIIPAMTQRTVLNYIGIGRFM